MDLVFYFGIDPELLTPDKSGSLKLQEIAARSRTLPRRLTKAGSRCHLLIRRLTVKGVTFTALANSSFVIWSAVPLATSVPIVRARVTST